MRLWPFVALSLAGCSFGGTTTPSGATHTAPPPPPVASETRDSSHSVGSITRVQDLLRSEGFFAGPSDGVWGPKTETAVRAYQRAHGLEMTGKLDRPTLAAMEPDPPPGVAR